MLIKNRANASSLNLSDLFKNNQGGDSIRYENFHFNMKIKGKQADYSKCINLKDYVIIEPFNITSIQAVIQFISALITQAAVHG
jgi:hypothetical protein